MSMLWLGVQLFRGHPGKKTQEHVPSEQEKAAQEKARQEAAWEVRKRKQKETEHWLEVPPALKERFANHAVLGYAVLL